MSKHNYKIYSTLNNQSSLFDDTSRIEVSNYVNEQRGSTKAMIGSVDRCEGSGGVNDCYNERRAES